MKILISACLLGVRCRYDGASKPVACLDALRRKHQLIPVCPEILGGLPTPRIPAEVLGDHVRTQDGRDVTSAYERGAQETLRLYRLLDCDCALLKERSPACGCGRIYDGSFSHTLTDGNGIAAGLLLLQGIPVFGESDLPSLLSREA